MKMNRILAARCLSRLLIPFIGVLGWGGWTVSMPAKAGAWGMDCVGGFEQKLSVEYREFDGSEVFTNLPVPGIEIYHKIIDVPNNCDTLEITISAVGDNFTGATKWLTCKVDDNFCNPGKTGATDTPGWISVENLSGDYHVFGEDQSIYYTWCVPITPGTHLVHLRMASDTMGLYVYIEAEHFIISTENTGGGCTLAAPAEDPPLLPGLSNPKLGTAPSVPALPGLTPAPPTLPAPSLPGVP